ncbi:MAG: hypothetical protein MI744_15655 [Pseudomonadales bacterium]|nr:hypothetical protein [Pseudomonadales bacterium]
METIPKSTNLLAAILSRFSDAIDRIHPDCSRHSQCARITCDMHQDVQSTLMEFARLQQDVARAWGSIDTRRFSAYVRKFNIIDFYFAILQISLVIFIVC